MSVKATFYAFSIFLVVTPSFGEDGSTQTKKSIEGLNLCAYIRSGGYATDNQKAACSPQVQYEASRNVSPAVEAPRSTAQGMDLVDGAVVCRSLDEVSWLYGRINSARHARQSLPPEMRKQFELMHGYDIGEEPRPSDYGCQLVPTGTTMQVRTDGYIQSVWGVMSDGRPFAGVTLPNMISR